MRNDRGRAEGGAPRRESPRAGGEHLGGRPGETQAHAEVRDPAELPAQAAATGDPPDCHAQAARLVGRLGGGAVRRGDNESGETRGDVRQVDECRARSPHAPPRTTVRSSRRTTGRRTPKVRRVVGRGRTAAVMGASFREGPVRLPDTSETRCLFDHSPWLFGCGSGRTDPEQDWPDRSRRPGLGRVEPVWGESSRSGANQSGSERIDLVR